MSNNPERSGRGCSLLTGAGCAVILALIAGICGFVLGIANLHIERGPGVAVLDIRDELASEQAILRQLDELLRNPDTKAVVLRVDSPGGVITVAEEVYNGIKRAADKGTPIVASMGATAASGAYLICLGAERIFANRSTLTGSIGVMVEYSSPQELFTKIGLKFDTIASGEFKGLGSWGEPMTERQRQHMQEIVNDFHSMFVDLVAKTRNIETEKVRELADGRMFTGSQAIAAGLVDELGDLEDAVQYAGRRAGIEGKPRIIRATERQYRLPDILDQLGIPAWGDIGQHAFSKTLVAR